MGRNRKTIQDFLAESEPEDDQWQQQESDQQQQWEQEYEENLHNLEQ